jgi:hypothetical protein
LSTATNDKAAMACIVHRAVMLDTKVSDLRTTARVQGHQYTLRWAHNLGNIASAVLLLNLYTKSLFTRHARLWHLGKTLHTKELHVKSIIESSLTSQDNVSRSTSKSTNTSKFLILKVITWFVDQFVARELQSRSMPRMKTNNILASQFMRLVHRFRALIQPTTKNMILDIQHHHQQPRCVRDMSRRVWHSLSLLIISLVSLSVKS